MEEIWKDIEGYEGWYQVSNLGRIKGLERKIYNSATGYGVRKEKIRTPKRSADGYRNITLSKNGVDKTFAVHRLVAKHFIPNPNNLKEVNHIDFNRENNSVENLEWTTHKDNVNYSSNQGRYKNNKTGIKNGRAQPIDVYKDGKYIKSFDYIGECCYWLKESLELKGKINTIRSFITKRHKLNLPAYGYIFIFK